VIFGLISCRSLSIIRPQIAGFACFVVIFGLASRRDWSRLLWVGVPILFALWANLHGSFLIGFGLLGLLWLGTTIDQYVRTKQLTRFASLKYLLMLQLAIIAVLFNPYGLEIFAAVESISNHPNFSNLVEWKPVTLRMYHGKVLVGSSILLILLYRLTPRRVSFAEPLILFVFAVAGFWSVRLVVWFSPIAAYYTVLHAHAILKRQRLFQHRSGAEAKLTEVPQRTGLNTVVAVGLSWIFFAYTPFGTTLLHGYPAEPEARFEFYRSNLGRETPALLASYLREHEPNGLIFNTYEWGDYLLWTGPAERQLYLNSHAHLIPREVWLDYFVIANVNRGWEDKLDRYGVNTVVADKKRRSRLIDLLKRSELWELDYEDDQGAILVRIDPLLNGMILD